MAASRGTQTDAVGDVTLKHSLLRERELAQTKKNNNNKKNPNRKQEDVHFLPAIRRRLLGNRGVSAEPVTVLVKR